MKTDNVINAIDELMTIINDYHIEGVQTQLGYLESFRDDLVGDINLAERDKLSTYQVLFPRHGGLSDIHYWHNDFELCKKVNTRISNNTTIIANFLLRK